MGSSVWRFRRLATIGCALAALVYACAGKSQNPIQHYGSNQLSCLVTLPSYCCQSAGAPPACIASFASAQQCSSWGAGAKLSIYATPCQGMTAVRVIGQYSMYYVYDSSSQLLAVGDDAASSDPRSGAIECGAGPAGFVIPSACADIWLGTPGSQPCSSGTSTAASVCH